MLHRTCRRLQTLGVPGRLQCQSQRGSAWVSMGHCGSWLGVGRASEGQQGRRVAVGTWAEPRSAHSPQPRSVSSSIVPVPGLGRTQLGRQRRERWEEGPSSQYSAPPSSGSADAGGAESCFGGPDPPCCWWVGKWFAVVLRQRMKPAPETPYTEEEDGEWQNGAVVGWGWWIPALGTVPAPLQPWGWIWGGLGGSTKSSQLLGCSPTATRWHWGCGASLSSLGIPWGCQHWTRHWPGELQACRATDTQVKQGLSVCPSPCLPASSVIPLPSR